MALIMIVEDSSTDQLAIRRIVESGGHKTLLAISGDDAIAKAKVERPDLILMDLVMPKMNGFQATRKLSSDPDTSDIPVIILTSRDQESDKIWGLRQGARDYITKPPEKTELLTRISKTLAGG